MSLVIENPTCANSAYAKVKYDRHEEESESSSDDEDANEAESAASSSSDSSLGIGPAASRQTKKRRRRPDESEDEDEFFIGDDADLSPAAKRLRAEALKASLPKTDNEVLEPPLNRPSIEKLPDTVHLTLLGTVSSVVQNVIVIQSSLSGHDSVLDAGTIVCSQDRRVLGEIFETFGPVQSPCYSIRFSSADDPLLSECAKGAAVFYAPDDQSLASIMQTSALKEKGSDASNLYDEEVHGYEIEFSDDEAEAAYKRNLKQQRQANRQRRQETAEADDIISLHEDEAEDIRTLQIDGDLEYDPLPRISSATPNGKDSAMTEGAPQAVEEMLAGSAIKQSDLEAVASAIGLHSSSTATLGSMPVVSSTQTVDASTTKAPQLNAIAQSQNSSVQRGSFSPPGNQRQRGRGQANRSRGGRGRGRGNQQNSQGSDRKWTSDQSHTATHPGEQYKRSSRGGERGGRGRGGSSRGHSNGQQRGRGRPFQQSNDRAPMPAASHVSSDDRLGPPPSFLPQRPTFADAFTQAGSAYSSATYQSPSHNGGSDAAQSVSAALQTEPLRWQPSQQYGYGTSSFATPTDLRYSQSQNTSFYPNNNMRYDATAALSSSARSGLGSASSAEYSPYTPSYRSPVIGHSYSGASQSAASGHEGSYRTPSNGPYSPRASSSGLPQYKR